MEDLIKEIGINETFTKKRKQPKKFNHVIDNIPLKKELNYMVDLLELPKTKEGFRYCLVLTDLATKKFDIEPMKTKTSKSALDALKKIFKRGILHIPYATIQSDNGGEFKGEFHDYLSKNNIFHKTSIKGRHTQQSVVERLNRELARLFMGYLNMKEEETDKPYNEWTDIIEIVRKKLNEFREVKLPKNPADVDYSFPIFEKQSMFKIGDLVHRLLDYPKNAFGHDQPTEKFRMGDYVYEKNPREIVDVFYYAPPNTYRYELEGLPNVSYTEHQLMKSKQNTKKYVVSKLVDKRKFKGVIQYKIRWKGYKKENDTWENRKTLIEDGLKSYIDDYEKQH